jgi:mitochondrial-processing peptidase subunit alpha
VSNMSYDAVVSDLSLTVVSAFIFVDWKTGLPLIAEERKLNQLTPCAVADFVADHVTPDRIVFSAANIAHDDLIKMVEVNFKSLGKSPLAGGTEVARYTGGSVHIAGDGPGHVAIGFEGVSWSDDDLVAVCVLHTMLGGGGSFSSGGPGKGMYTRLYQDILTRHAWVTSAVAFNHCYADSGVFGIHASCEDPASLNNLIEVVGSSVAKMAGTLGNGELQRAKNMTKGSLMMNLEGRAVVCEDIGRQILGSGLYVGPADLVKAIDAVDEQAICRVAQRITSSKPSLVLYGEEYATHAYEAIEGSIKSQAKIAV